MCITQSSPQRYTNHTSCMCLKFYRTLNFELIIIKTRLRSSLLAVRFECDFNEFYRKIIKNFFHKNGDNFSLNMTPNENEYYHLWISVDVHIVTWRPPLPPMSVIFFLSILHNDSNSYRTKIRIS